MNSCHVVSSGARVPRWCFNGTFSYEWWPLVWKDGDLTSLDAMGSSSFPPKSLSDFWEAQNQVFSQKNGLKNPQTHPNVIDFNKNHHDSLIVCWWSQIVLAYTGLYPIEWCVWKWGISSNDYFILGIMIFNQWIQWGTKYFHTNPFPTCELGWPAWPARPGYLT